MDVNGKHNIGFFTPVVFNKPNKTAKEKAVEFVDGYFHLFGKKVLINQDSTTIVDPSKSTWKIYIKATLIIASCLTIVIPIGMFIAKIALRKDFKQNFLNKPSQTPIVPEKLTDPTINNAHTKQSSAEIIEEKDSFITKNQKTIPNETQIKEEIPQPNVKTEIETQSTQKKQQLIHNQGANDLQAASEQITDKTEPDQDDFQNSLNNSESQKQFNQLLDGIKSIREKLKNENLSDLETETIVKECQNLKSQIDNEFHGHSELFKELALLTEVISSEVASSIGEKISAIQIAEEENLDEIMEKLNTYKALLNQLPESLLKQTTLEYLDNKKSCINTKVALNSPTPKITQIDPNDSLSDKFKKGIEHKLLENISNSTNANKTDKNETETPISDLAIDHAINQYHELKNQIEIDYAKDPSEIFKILKNKIDEMPAGISAAIAQKIMSINLTDNTLTNENYETIKAQLIKYQQQLNKLPDNAPKTVALALLNQLESEIKNRTKN